ncbi:polyisoprenoid-binding protein [Methylobacterium indicum]|uniref:Polyisoprenoid-binding protein n=1 Tax=Methylobacterium indicum TaxID=1775910 RepID=A0ABR5HCS7_9HYPH|nr:polyisoprenoid-binding protein [Methylobacterium indicum]KMO23281.1 polyisoprenoid-binding protein [Methylobacterium indicum]KTS35024.1 polyisoprenoid-binding protein [Methylobacterium indicum]KTS39681.1 polyisoprenoid-binding protein [Methylobacterium indicum]KTS51327.1 polyisoprenoid-binding protein [Methylobacterium indicum]
MSVLALGLVAGLALAAPAGAQGAATRDPAQIQAGTYVVDPNHTQAVFTVTHFGFSPYTGIFSDVSGTLELQPTKPAESRLKVTVPVKSLYAPSQHLVESLKSDKWLDVAQFPDMTFTSTKVTPEGKDKAKVVGDLTLHGVTKPVTLEVTLVGAGANPMNKKVTVGFEAKGTIKRSDFGVKTFVPAISDEVHLVLNGAFERKD